MPRPRWNAFWRSSAPYRPARRPRSVRRCARPSRHGFASYCPARFPRRLSRRVRLRHVLHRPLRRHGREGREQSQRCGFLEVRRPNTNARSESSFLGRSSAPRRVRRCAWGRLRPAAPSGGPGGVRPAALRGSRRESPDRQLLDARPPAARTRVSGPHRDRAGGRRPAARGAEGHARQVRRRGTAIRSLRRNRARSAGPRNVPGDAPSRCLPCDPRVAPGPLGRAERPPAPVDTDPVTEPNTERS